MVDPYEFIVRESVVSSSQEDVLKHIPGWEGKQEDEPLLSPSQAPLSRLHGSDSSDEESERAPTSAFCMQEPLEWASPDTQACQDHDSYNPAFESDRSRSLSPHAHYGDLWGSRLITQSQAVKKRKEERILAAVNDCCTFKDVPPLQAAGFDLGNMSRREQREVHLQTISKERTESFGKDYGQAQTYKPVELGDTLGCLKQCGVSHILDVGQPDLHSIVDLDAEMVDGNGIIQNISKTQAMDKLAFIFDQVSCRKSPGVVEDEQQVKSGISVSIRLEVTPAEEAMVRPRISPTTVGDVPVENIRKRKDKGVCAFSKSSQKLKSPKEPNCEQQHSNPASEAKQHTNKEVEGTQSKSQGECVTGSSDPKCLLAFVPGNENNISAHGMEKTSKTELVRDLADDTTDCTLLRLFPESVMDVVMLVSEVLPTPGPDDPDFLSIMMNTGVSLPLPFRDCIGRFICNKSMMS
eukprot:c15731_g1_i1 orf=51-1445(+)